MQSFLAAVSRRALDSQEPRYVVTTGHDDDATAEARATTLVAQLNAYGHCRAVLVPRFSTSAKPDTLSKLLSRHLAHAVVVVDGKGTHARMASGSDLQLHGGIGVLRVRNVLNGLNDNLISAW
jgi:hypothetical protein